MQAESSFQAVVTLFFIDTARSLLSYLQTIYSLLEDGGIWINYAPLLYGTAPLVQLSLDEIFVMGEEMGFVFEEKGEGEVLYNYNESTMYRHGYVGQRWVARKINRKREGEGWLLGGW
ncbi:hypothetical protein AC579_4920 [Pseudocercospora musae]|uniref:Uncharacterized protein n=1 Tax=Pseudocercospora musae TaxID=113226 RepID=A0A139IEG5_9PEZI|nr:hypothetical protein AC579_4920 [Pseudocercospora musae]